MAGGLSDYLENKILDLAFGAVAYSRPATVYLEPYEANPNDAGAGGDVPDSGYSSRVAVTNNATNFPAASGGVKTLAVAQTLYTASGAETLTGVGIWDAASSGNLLGLFVPGANLVTSSGKRVLIPAGTLALTGPWQAAFANALLDHVFGGGDYTPLANIYYALATNSAELSGNAYARQAVANNATHFPAASGGAKGNGVAVSFGPATPSDWSQATRVRLYDASSNGNMLLEQTLAAAVTVLAGETATFDVGEFDLSLA
jgi:hypothetical protein